MSVDVERARARLARALDLAEQTPACCLLPEMPGASKASIDARVGDPLVAAADYRRLIDHWRRAGMWSTQWTMLRAIAGLLARLGRSRDAAVLIGAVRATRAGHRIFGARRDHPGDARDATCARRSVTTPTRRRDCQGAMLDGDAAVEHALRAL